MRQQLSKDKLGSLLQAENIEGLSYRQIVELFHEEPVRSES